MDIEAERERGGKEGRREGQRKRGNAIISTCTIYIQYSSEATCNCHSRAYRGRERERKERGRERGTEEEGECHY